MSTTALDDAVAVLLARSLEAWRVSGTVERAGDGALAVTVAGRELRIARAPADLPFRWVVEEAGRTRGATSVTGVLRHVRAAVDPLWRPVRLRIAALPLPLAPP
ncbi:MAG TPA: hypothetical protein VFA64_10155 [Hyphomicrobiaceae bacterium]|nr:hypothetical protein [Hyphomicrobiaceae bacterium]